MTFYTCVSFILCHSISPRRSNPAHCMPCRPTYIVQNITILLELFTFSFCKIMMNLVAKAMIIKK